MLFQFTNTGPCTGVYMLLILFSVIVPFYAGLQEEEIDYEEGRIIFSCLQALAMANETITAL